MKKKKNIFVLIVLIILILALLIGVLFIKKGNDKESGTSVSDKDYVVASSTYARLDIFWDEEEYDIFIKDGVLFVGEERISIINEKIKYFYFNRYQCSHQTVFYFLTENGNVYVIQIIDTDNGNLNKFHQLEKLNYSNVTDIVSIANPNYGRPLDDKSGMIDNVDDYLYALIDGKKYKLEYQYRC